MIYCVEDDSAIRDIEVYALRSTGFEAEGLENGEQLFEVLSGFGLDGLLTQKGFAASKLPKQLVVQIVSIGNDHNSGAIQTFLEKVSEKHHR